MLELRGSVISLLPSQGLERFAESELDKMPFNDSLGFPQLRVVVGLNPDPQFAVRCIQDCCSADEAAFSVVAITGNVDLVSEMPAKLRQVSGCVLCLENCQRFHSE